MGGLCLGKFVSTSEERAPTPWAARGADHFAGPLPSATLGDVNANSLLASLLVSSIGFVLFSYGRRQTRLPHLAVGIALLVYPYFVGDLALLFAIAAGLLGLLWLAVRLGW